MLRTRNPRAALRVVLALERLAEDEGEETAGMAGALSFGILVVAMGSGDKQHYLPTALIGGFGDPRGRRDPRKALVCWRRRDSTAVREPSAEAVGWRYRIYRLAEPAPGVDPDIVNAVWNDVERELPGAVRRLESNTETDADHEWLLAYAGTAGVRHPQFADAVHRWLPQMDLPIVSGDDVQATAWLLCATVGRSLKPGVGGCCTVRRWLLASSSTSLAGLKAYWANA